jgi:hypothetical protein
MILKKCSGGAALHCRVFAKMLFSSTTCSVYLAPFILLRSSIDLLSFFIPLRSRCNSYLHRRKRLNIYLGQSCVEISKDQIIQHARACRRFIQIEKVQFKFDSKTFLRFYRMILKKRSVGAAFQCAVVAQLWFLLRSCIDLLKFLIPLLCRCNLIFTIGSGKINTCGNLVLNYQKTR